MYLTYDEYQAMGGILSAAAFAKYESEARIKVDYYTFKRLTKDTEFSENVKLCMMKIIGLLNDYEKYYGKVADMSTPILQSQSNDGVSVSYGGYVGNTAPSDIKSIKTQTDDNISMVIREYLISETNMSGQYLLYRGVGQNE